jgi:hypothetical protein
MIYFLTKKNHFQNDSGKKDAGIKIYNNQEGLKNINIRN